MAVHRQAAVSCVLWSIGSISSAVAAEPPGTTRLAAADLKKLSIEALLDLEVTSVSKRPERLADAPASIFVITADAIRRAGAATLPDALRLAPNLQVARGDPSQYAISSRGFNNTVGNKLLVLIDGRTVYTPLFSGVFWDQQELMLEDIERIEVISGPGATLWGANAVNGVINVITRSATETQGTLLSATAGDADQRYSLRYGGSAGRNGAFRVYGVLSEADRMPASDGTVARNAWERAQVGFRADWTLDRDAFTLQADAYRGETEHRGFVGPFEITPLKVEGANVLARWTRQLSSGADFKVQAYYDHTRREDFILFGPRADVLDLEFQHRLPKGAHTIVWGGGYRHSSDDIDPALFSRFIPQSRSLSWANIFVQDEIALNDTLALTAGLKLEDNDYTGIEHLPSLRLAWRPLERHMLWGAVSRAVRSPSRFDRDVYTPPAGPPFIVAGGPNFVSEVAKVVEIGYRVAPINTLTASVTVFHHDWDHLRSGTQLPLPIYLANDIEGTTYGIEMWADWQVLGPWRLSAGWNTLHKNLKFKPGKGDTVGTDNPTLHNDPSYQWMLRSTVDLPANVELDVSVRGVDALTVQPIPEYTELDARIAWQPRPYLELALVGRNLLHDSHPEFGALPARYEIERSFSGQLIWSF